MESGREWKTQKIMGKYQYFALTTSLSKRAAVKQMKQTGFIIRGLSALHAKKDRDPEWHLKQVFTINISLKIEWSLKLS